MSSRLLIFMVAMVFFNLLGAHAFAGQDEPMVTPIILAQAGYPPICNEFRGCGPCEGNPLLGDRKKRCEWACLTGYPRVEYVRCEAEE